MLTHLGPIEQLGQSLNCLVHPALAAVGSSVPGAGWFRAGALSPGFDAFRQPDARMEGSTGCPSPLAREP